MQQNTALALEVFTAGEVHDVAYQNVGRTLFLQWRREIMKFSTGHQDT